LTWRYTNGIAGRIGRSNSQQVDWLANKICWGVGLNNPKIMAGLLPVRVKWLMKVHFPLSVIPGTATTHVSVPRAQNEVSVDLVKVSRRAPIGPGQSQDPWKYMEAYLPHSKSEASPPARITPLRNLSEGQGRRTYKGQEGLKQSSQCNRVLICSLEPFATQQGIRGGRDGMKKKLHKISTWAQIMQTSSPPPSRPRRTVTAIKSKAQ
jgi:hypothetical protein